MDEAVSPSPHSKSSGEKDLGSLSGISRAILGFLDNRAAEQIDFVREICAINSYSRNKPGVDRVAEVICGRMAKIMPHHQMAPQQEVGNHHIWRTSSTGSKSIYLVGHMDTVFPPDHPFQSCRVEGDVMTGPGCGDMKGGLSVIVYALDALREAGILGKLRITVIFNSDEELGSFTSRRTFLEERQKAEACLVVESAGLQRQVVISRNGKMGARIVATGEERHVGTGTHEKASAILELAHKIIALEELNGFLPGVSVNAGKVEGGLSSTTVPARAECSLDIRWEREEHREALVGEIRARMERIAQPGCRVEFEELNSRPSMPANAGSQDLLRLAQRAARRIGQKFESEHRRGTSDSNFFGSAGVPTLDGFGPVADHHHTANEYIEIPTLRERAALLAHVLLEHGIASRQLSVS